MQADENLMKHMGLQSTSKAFKARLSSYSSAIVHPKAQGPILTGQAPVAQPPKPGCRPCWENQAHAREAASAYGGRGQSVTYEPD